MKTIASGDRRRTAKGICWKHYYKQSKYHRVQHAVHKYYTLLPALQPFRGPALPLHTAWFNIQQCYVLPTQCMYLHVLCGSENKQRLFPYTASTDLFL